MAAGRMAGDVKAARIAAELLRIPVDPGDRAAHLLGHRQEVAADRIDIVEVGDDAVGAGVNEQLGEVGEVARAPVPPGAAMDVDVDRGVIMLAAVDVDTLDLARTVLEAQRLAEHGARDRAVGIAPGVDLVAVGRIDRLVVGIVERLLVHVEPDERPLGACERCGLSHAVSTCNRYASPAERLGRRAGREQPRLWKDRLKASAIPIPDLGRMQPLSAFAPAQAEAQSFRQGVWPLGPRLREGERRKSGTEIVHAWLQTAKLHRPQVWSGLGFARPLFPSPKV